MLVTLVAAMFINTSSARTYYTYTPYFMTRADLEQSVKYVKGGRELVDPAKIYVKGDKIYVSERYKGVHIINNSLIDTPVNEAFITAPGCVDMAIKGDILYIDNSTDLVAFDLAQKKVTKRITCLPEPLAPDGTDGSRISRPEGYVLVGWTKTASRTDYYYE